MIMPKPVDELIFNENNIQLKKYIDKKNCQIQTYSYDEITSVKMTLGTKGYVYINYHNGLLDCVNIDITVNSQDIHISMFTNDDTYLICTIAKYFNKTNNFTYKINEDLNEYEREGLAKAFAKLANVKA
jgi:hypothetical protein